MKSSTESSGFFLAVLLVASVPRGQTSSAAMLSGGMQALKAGDYPFGTIQLEQSRYREAEISLKHAVDLDSNVALYHAALGVALYKLERPGDSKKELDRALDLNPKTPPAYLWRSRVLENLQKRDEAIADLQTYVFLIPDSVSAYDELAKLYSAAGQPQQASNARAKANTLKSENADTHLYPSGSIINGISSD